jgi:hypothetical protein
MNTWLRDVFELSGGCIEEPRVFDQQAQAQHGPCFGPAAERAGRFDQIVERVAAAPGVERASAGSEVRRPASMDY